MDRFILHAPRPLRKFGLVALEAMCSEVPVIATRVGGIPEMLKDREHGFLFDVGDVRSMGQAALEVLTQPDLGLSLGRSAREHAIRSFNSQSIVERYEDLYRRTVRQARSR